MKHLILQAVILLLCCSCAWTETPTNVSREPETVVLLHGYGRSPFSMLPLQKSLVSAGFKVHNIGYPSLRYSPAELVDFLGQKLQECCKNSTRLHFVTHSLGGILVRAYLAEHQPANMGRVVMLAPPNQGSEIADRVKSSQFLSFILGPTVIQLGTGDGSLPRRLPAPWYDLGIIAGVDDFNPVGNFFVPEPSDGTVSVSNTRLEGMTDFVTVQKSHTFIMRSVDVNEYVIRFLCTGSFREI